jgi:small-conductance mechanosensitive channel
VAMSSTACPHGLARETCQICRVLDPTPVPGGRRPARRRGRFSGNLAVVAIVAVIGFVVFGWVAAAFFAVLRIVELVAVAAVAGWVGFKLGARQGRRPH